MIVKDDNAYRDTDSEKRFTEKVHYIMSKCRYRRDLDGVGICSLNVAPCEKVLFDGACEAVRDWIHSREERKNG